MKNSKLLLFTIVMSAMLLSTPIARAETEPLNFVAHLAGANEVPARDTQARGLAKFQVSPDGTALRFKLIVANIEHVFMAHIHIAPAGTNGPIVLFLYGPVAPGGGRVDGPISLGTRTASDLVGPLAGHPLSDLVDQMASGNAYVNVHTNDGVDPPNTGPGDFPGGEIRGQIELAD